MLEWSREFYDAMINHPKVIEEYEKLKGDSKHETKSTST